MTKHKDKRVTNVNSINPVDYFNQNCVEHTFELLLRIKNVERTGIKSITYIKNVSDKSKRMIVFDEVTNFFEAEMENGLNMPIGIKHTPFMMLQKYVYKGNWRAAVNYVIYQLMNNNNDYVRISTEYYRRIIKSDRYGVKRASQSIWKRQTIVDDYGKDFLSQVEKFKSFTIEPNNKEFKRDHDNCYNLYNEFDHKPMPLKKYKGTEGWEWTNTLLKHIFGEQYTLGLIYLKVLYENPKQALPILVLISEERQTGKTTFVNFMSLLFGANSVVINPQDISNSFNGSYAEKNIIMIEESHFDSRQALEKIKNLSTQKEILVNSKFVAQYSIPFFGKIIITSNDENKFSKVDDPEIRYWVRKIPTLEGRANHEILTDLKNEIPAFLCFLENMATIETEPNNLLKSDGTVLTSRSRMVFTKEELETDALTFVKKESRESLHKDLEIYLDNHGQQNVSVEIFYFISINIKDRFFPHNHRFSTSYINRVLKNNMKLEKADKTMRFIPLQQSDITEDSIVGRPYMYKNPYFGVEDEHKPDVPF